MTPPSFRRRAVLGAAAGALFAPLLAGCSDGGGASTAAGGKVTLTFAWWGNDDRAQRTNAAVALFEKRHPNITVRTSFVDQSSTSAYGPMFAMSVISIVPIVLFFFAFQRYLVEGMATSGLKG